MLLVVVADVLVGDEGVQPFVDVALLIAVLQQRATVFLQFLGHVLFLLGEAGFRHVQEQELLRPGLDVLLRKPQAVLGRHAGGDVFRQFRPHQPVVADARDHGVAEQLGGRVRHPVHHLARHGQEGDEKRTFLHSPQI